MRPRLAPPRVAFQLFRAAVLIAVLAAFLRVWGGGVGGGSGLAAGYFVSTTGSDSNPGTIAQPFATLGKCQAAMESGSTKTCYVRAGTYSSPSATQTGCNNNAAPANIVQLTHAKGDDGTTYSYYPPDGIGNAIIDGGSTIPTAFCVYHVKNVTVTGLTFQHFTSSPLFMANWDANDGNGTGDTFSNDTVLNSAGTNAGINAAGWIENFSILNNAIENIAAQGIAVSTTQTSTVGGLTGGMIKGNAVINTCTGSSDCGGIYFRDYQVPPSTNVTLQNNYVYQAQAAGPGANLIYLDDGMSNVTASGNVLIAGGATSSCYKIHGGANDVFTNNVCDEGAGNDILFYQQTTFTPSSNFPMTGNSTSGNTIVCLAASLCGNGYVGASPLAPVPQANTGSTYWNYGAVTTVKTIGTSGAAGDSAPILANPNLTCNWTLGRSFGPPGFVVPMTGSPPSWLNGCDPTTAVLPQYNDAYANWVNAGLQKIGGIPTRSTVCATVNPSGITPPASGDDAANINAAIASCPSGDVLMLGPGTITLDNTEQIIVNQPITLRGTGTCNNASSTYCATVILQRNGILPWTGGKCGVDISHQVACGSNPAIRVQPAAMGTSPFDFGWASCGALSLPASCGAAELDADAAAGATTVRVNSTTGISAGAWVLIDEASGATWQTDAVGPNLYGQVWAAPDWLSTSGSPATGRVQWGKYSVTTSAGDMGVGEYPYNNPHISQSFWDRVTSEIHLVSAVGPGPCPGVNCTITFDDPLTVAFRKSGSTTFTGAISGTTLTTSGDSCTLSVGQIVSDATNTTQDGTYVTAVNACGGGTGNYTVSRSQVVSSETMIGAAHQAHIYPSAHQNGTPMSFLQQAGIENLTISRPSGGGIDFLFCAYCWTKNVEVVNWYGGGINITYSVRTQIDTTFVNNCGNSVNSGAEYPLGIQNSSTEVLVVNSITRVCGKGMVGKTGTAAVVAYNYIDDAMYDSYSGIGDYWVEMGANGSHYAGTHHYLFEGNWSFNLDNDDTHGNAVYHVYFRNWATALRAPFTDPSIPGSVNDATGTGFSCGTTGPSGCVANPPANLRAAGPMAHLYWFGYVGNVLGTSGTTTAGNGWTYSNGNCYVSKLIWCSGWQNNTTNSDSNLTGSSPFIFRHGNYDYVNGAIVDWTSGYSHSLPNSFYSANAPPFFSAVGATGCVYPWPWVTPTGTSQIQLPTGSGCTADSALPAKARFDAGTPFIQP